MKKTDRRYALLAAVLTCLMALSPLGTALATRAMAEGGPAHISAFEPLEDWQAAVQSETGTDLDALGLPDALSATVDGERAEVAVKSWRSAPAYDRDAAGGYALTPTFDEALYEVDADAEVPTVEVTLTGRQREPEPAIEDEPEDVIEAEPDAALEDEPEDVTEAEPDAALEDESETEPEAAQPEPPVEPAEESPKAATQTLTEVMPLDESVAIQRIEAGQQPSLPAELAVKIDGEDAQLSVSWTPDREFGAPDEYAFSAGFDQANLRPAEAVVLPKVRVTVLEPAPVVTDIAPLDASVSEQQAPVGTPLEDLNLPATLPATLDSGERMALGVAWQSDTPYDASEAATYHFEASALGDYALGDAVKLPGIEVSLSAAVQVITQIEPPLGPGVTARQVPFGTPEDEIGLPNQLQVTVNNDGEGKQSLAASWTCTAPYNPESAGPYLFTAALADQAGYALAPGVAMPQVTVEVLGPQGIQVTNPAPAQLSCAVGEPASFSVTASGGKAPYTYQWTRYPSAADAQDQVNGVAIGPNTNELSFLAEIGHNGTCYRCLVTDDRGLSATSGAASLTVFAPNKADPALNAVAIPNEKLYANRAFTIRATGDRQDERGTYRGDTRYVPESWRSGSQNGIFGAESPYEAQVRLKSPGDKTIAVLFTEQRYTEDGWRDTGATDEQRVEVSILPVRVRGIHFDQSDVYLDEGDRLKLRYTIDPSDATNQDVRFYSDDEDIATVSDDGRVTAQSPGEAVITVVSLDDEGIYDECTVSVAATDDEDDAFYDDDDVPQTSDPALPMWALGAIIGAAVLVLVGVLIYYRKRGSGK